MADHSTVVDHQTGIYIHKDLPLAFSWVRIVCSVNLNILFCFGL